MRRREQGGYGNSATSYFQAMANISGSETNSFSTSASVMSWFNLSAEQKRFVAWLNWTDTKDTVAIEINVTAPADEPPATKVSDIVIVGSET